MDKIYQLSLEVHRAHKGKLAVASKVPLESRDDLSVAYTPGVAEICRAIAADVVQARELTLKSNTVGIVTDGSAILGLGNLGPEAAIPVMEGKAILFKKFADVDAFPLCLATQDTDEIVETVRRIAPVFGAINLEDIAAPRCFEVEARLREALDIPVLHDDQHGTAVVVLAALINAMAIVGKEIRSARIVINGAGAAGTATADLLLAYGCRNILLCDTHGIIVEGRKGLTPAKESLALRTNREKISGSLEAAIKKADAFIGVSAPNVLTPEMVESMEVKAIVLALANPVPEIMPDVALSAGAAIVATGRSDFPNQVNNALAFPGIFRGAIDNKVRQFTDAMLIRAAEALAACVSDPKAEKILPSIFDEGVSAAVAKAIHN